MNLKDKCKELGISLAEGKEQFGLTHWNQPVPEQEIDDVGTVAEEVIETLEQVADLVEAVANDPDLLLKARALQTGIGFKTPAYLRFVLDNKDLLAEEFELVKKLIERCLCEK
jgi:hypothetical protein